MPALRPKGKELSYHWVVTATLSRGLELGGPWIRVWTRHVFGQTCQNANTNSFPSESWTPLAISSTSVFPLNLMSRFLIWIFGGLPFLVSSVTSFARSRMTPGKASVVRVLSEDARRPGYGAVRMEFCSNAFAPRRLSACDDLAHPCFRFVPCSFANVAYMILCPP